jgi:histidine phosphotransferase ChpT
MHAGSDFKLIELLCSRLCHELISPVTAVNNGLELFCEGDPNLFNETLGLVRQSAGEASRRLQFYRLAYGPAAGAESAPGLPTARELAKGLLQGGKIGLDWPEGDEERSLPVTSESVKLLLNMIALGVEALPRGGRLSVRIGGVPGAATAGVTVTGAGAGLKEEMRAAMAETVEIGSLDPRTVQAYFTARLAARLGAELALEEPQPGTTHLSARLPVVE